MTKAKQFVLSILKINIINISTRSNTLHTFLNSFPFAIVQKCAEPTRIKMMEDGYQKIVVELKGVRELLGDLPNAVYKLQENWRPICIRMMIITMADSLKT